MNDRKLSEEAGLDPEVFHDNQLRLDDFAELIRADERNKCAQDYLQDCCNAVEAARLEERESCAKLIEELGERQTNQSMLEYSDYAAAIRATR